MAYLPGVPDVGPKPVSTVPTTVGKSSGISAVAHSVGKPGRTQDLGSIVGRPGAGSSTITGGDAAMHSIGHYGKTPPAGMGGSGNGVDPTAHAGAKIIRGGSGGLGRHVRQGGLGPGKLSAPGQSDQNYSQMNNQDTE